MQITRHAHLSYMNRVVPFLGIAYFIQSYLYLSLGPEDFMREAVAFLGLGLVMLIGAFFAYDQFHQIKLYGHHLEVGVRFFKLKKEVLYKNIIKIEITGNHSKFKDMILILQDESVIRLLHIDNAEEIKKHILLHR